MRWAQSTYRGRRGRAIYDLRRRLKRKHDARIQTAICLQKRWRGRTGREFYRRKRSAKLLVDFVRKSLWEKLQDRAFGGRPLPRMKRSGPGSRPGEPYALPPSEPVDEPTAETASVRTNDGEEMVAVRSEDSDEEFIQYLKKVSRTPAPSSTSTPSASPPGSSASRPRSARGRKKKKNSASACFINVLHQRALGRNPAAAGAAWPPPTDYDGEGGAGRTPDPRAATVAFFGCVASPSSSPASSGRGIPESTKPGSPAANWSSTLANFLAPREVTAPVSVESPSPRSRLIGVSRPFF